MFQIYGYVGVTVIPVDDSPVTGGATTGDSPGVEVSAPTVTGAGGRRAAALTSAGLTAFPSVPIKLSPPACTITAGVPEALLKETVPSTTLKFTVSNSKLVPRTEALAVVL